MDLKETLSTLARLAAVETTISDFYAACAGASPAESGFWVALAGQERVHAAQMLEMARMVNEAEGEGFSIGRTFPAVALKTFVGGLAGNLDAVRDGRLSGNRLYFVSVELEKTLVESRFHEFLKTDDIAFNTLVARVSDESRAHREILERKVRELRGGGAG